MYTGEDAGEIFSSAFAEFSGIAQHRDTRGSGRTEWQWFRDTLLASGLQAAEECFPRSPPATAVFAGNAERYMG